MAKLFKEPKNIFNWADIKTFLLRNQYNETLNLVVMDYFGKQYKPTELPSFLNTKYCLTLKNFDDKCRCGTTDRFLSTIGKPQNLVDYEANKRTYETLLLKRDENIGNLILTFEEFKNKTKIEVNKALNTTPNALDDLTKAVEDLKIETQYDELKTALTSAKFDVKKLSKLEKGVQDFKEFMSGLDILKSKIDLYTAKKRQAEIVYESKKAAFEAVESAFQKSGTATDSKAKDAANIELDSATIELAKYVDHVRASNNTHCADIEPDQFCLPPFEYLRKLSLSVPIKDKSGNIVPESDFDFTTHGLTVGAVLWLYYYERMGIFKILGALMDDYNYRGKYTITGNRKDSNGNPNGYSTLMDMVCTWHRLGMSSNLRDRICLYQRVLGVSIENNLGVESERNTGFMGTFNKLLDYMLEYYKDKRLAVAINNSTSGRSSVATQTSIKDTINLLRQQFEPFQYGRNQINTFLGIATVHATICLLYNIRKEIGVPDQYESPEEFIPAAYDILVAKRSVTLNETNRFIVHDNCASYGYRLLTDLETADLTQFQPVATGGALDLWLDDVEGWVEGYRNAYSAITERAETMI